MLQAHNMCAESSSCKCVCLCVRVSNILKFITKAGEKTVKHTDNGSKDYAQIALAQQSRIKVGKQIMVITVGW